MNNKMYFIVQMAAIVFLVITVVIQVLLFFNVSDRMSAIEQKQAVLGHRLEFILDNVYSLSSRVSDLAK